MQDFIVLDTEGKEERLRELAVLDRHGNELCNLFVQETLDQSIPQWRAQPLHDVLTTFFTLARGKQVVCHFAEHDSEVLQAACKQAGIAWEQLDFVCTCELARSLHPHLPNGHSLKALCQHFDLLWEKRSFNSVEAHTALYDTKFTYLLYRKLKSEQLQHRLHGKPNPFGDSRVDNPFEQHVDFPAVYQREFSQLTAILGEIKRDPNHQSKGAVIIGEAGNGKTHLIMRLAHEVLKNNRLLFIRQPNHPETVLHHIYSRILESFMETVPNSEYSQLEYLLAHSFSRIVLEHFEKNTSTNKDTAQVLQGIAQDHLNIYKALGKEGSDKKRNNWKIIERRTVTWWAENYGFSNHGCDIIKGLIKFCSYTDANKRHLVRKWLAGQEVDEEELKSIGLQNWQEAMDREEFALQAIRVFSKLSIEDQPLIIVFDQLESLRDHEALLRSFGEGLKQLFTEVSNSLIIITLFPDRWEHFKRFFDGSIVDRISQNTVHLNRPHEQELVHILSAKSQAYAIDIEELLMPEEVTDIVKQGSIRSMLNVAADYYRFKADGVPLPLHVRNFEESVLSELRKLREDVEKLKHKLNCRGESDTNITVASADLEILAYFERQKAQLAKEYPHAIISESDDLGKLRVLVKAWNAYKTFKIEYLHLRKRLLPEHLMLVFPKTPTQAEQKRVAGFLHSEGRTFTTRMKNLNELLVSHADILFELFRDARQREITASVGVQECERFRNCENNSFVCLNQESRLLFETLYKTVVAIQNQDYNADLYTVFSSFFASYPEHWFSKFVK